jgi:hypothetical protein
MRKRDDAGPVVILSSQFESAVSLSIMLVTSPPPTVLRLPAPRMESVVLPEGTTKVICEVQVQVPDGMLTVVVEEVTEFKAFCTSL